MRYLRALGNAFLFLLIVKSTVVFSQSGQKIIYQYDELGRLVAVEDTENGNRNYKYDPAGNRALVAVASLSSSSSAASVVGCSSVGIHVEAESYSAMFGVKTESSQDVGSSITLSYLDPGDWVSYGNSSLHVAVAGFYKIIVRVASPQGRGGLRFHEMDNSKQYGTFSMPVTGSYQTWVNVERQIFLEAGVHKFGFTIEDSGFNVNWFKVEPMCTGSSATSSLFASSLAASFSSGFSSSISSASGLDIQAPSVPGVPVAVSIEANSASFSWTPSTDNIGVKGYEYSLNNGVWRAAGVSPSVVVNNLNVATNYLIKVRAFDEAGNFSPASSETAFTTLDNILPTSPGIPVVSNNTHGKAKLSWSGSTDNVSIGGYEYTLNGTDWISNGTSLSVDFVNLVIDQQYTFSVRAFDISLNRSTPVSVNFAVTRFAAPTNLSAVIAQNCVWRATWNQVNSATSYYYVEESNGVQSGRYVSSLFADTSCLTGQPNSNKPYKVSACDNNGCGANAYFTALVSSSSVSSSSKSSSSVPVVTPSSSSSSSAPPSIPSSSSSSSSSVMAVVAMPRFSPASSTVFSGSGVVTLTPSDTVGATILYSINGASYSAYPSGGISITANSNITAKAIKAGMIDSQENNASYYVSVLPPRFGAASGTNFVGSGSVIILPSDTPGAMVQYSINGSAYTNYSSGSIPISINSTISIKAIKAGMRDSSEVSANYTVSVLPPTIAPYAAAFYQPVNVSITPGTTGSTIRYTTDFSAVTDLSNVYSTSFLLAASATVKARAYKANMKESEEVAVYFNIVPLPAPTGLNCSQYASPGTYRGTWNPVGGASFYRYRTIDAKEYDVSSGTAEVRPSRCEWVRACISSTVCGDKAYF